MSTPVYPSDFPTVQLQAIIGYVTHQNISLAEVALDAWWVQGYAQQQLLGSPAPVPKPLEAAMHPLAVHEAENPTVKPLTDAEAVKVMETAIEHHKAHAVPVKGKQPVEAFVVPWAQLALFLIQLLTKFAATPV